MALEIAGQPAAMADPNQGLFDDPAFGQHLETGNIVALDDLQPPVAGPRGHRCHNRPLVAAIGEDHLDEREQPASSPEQFLRPIAVLHIGRVNHDAQHQSERINQDVPLAAGDLLAGSYPRGLIEASALALWLSMICTEGLASWPASSRQLT